MEKINAPAIKGLIIPGKKRIHPPLLSGGRDAGPHPGHTSTPLVNRRASC